VTTFAAALARGRSALQAAGVESPGLDARLLLAAAAGLDIATLLARATEPLPASAAAAFEAHLQRRVEGLPVSRIIGEKEFWGLPFAVSADTLVPRPATETLVEAVLHEVRRRFSPGPTICDLGTGTGAILIALLRELPAARGVATDISAPALETARRNAERLGVAERISFHREDFGLGPKGPFDVVVSNPPYIAADRIPGLAPAVRHDPPLALDGGPDGLAAYRMILARSTELLSAGGLLAFEVGHDQGEAVASLCRAAGLRDLRIATDLAGIGRVVLATG